ncbi:MAG: UDP-glucose/GDP-mannose dehydrogenase family protein [bacterium]
MSEKLIVVGAGYVGLVAGACFASAGFTVGIVETNPDKLRSIKDSKVPFYEPGLSELLKEGIAHKRLSFYSNQKDAIESLNAQFIFCAVGTPESPDGSANLSYVEAALKDCVLNSKNHAYFIIKSTVPVGTAQKLQKMADNITPGKVSVLNNPEFLKEGTAVSDFLRPERVVIGGSPEAVEKVGAIYESFLLNQKPLIKIDSVSAELAKLGANLMLASRVSVVNQIARLASATGADIRSIEKVLKSDSRIGSKYLYAGLGFGGSCFPKDIKNFIDLCKKQGVDASVAEAIDTFNDEQKLIFVNQIIKDFPKASSTRIALLGLAFKPETDDVRESPALAIVEKLSALGYRFNAYDPKAMETFKSSIKKESNVRYCSSSEEALKDADALLLVTEWQEFQRIKAEDLKTCFKGKHIYDGKNIYSPIDFKDAGYIYYGVGRS